MTSLEGTRALGVGPAVPGRGRLRGEMIPADGDVQSPRVWGLDAEVLHEAWWAARGVARIPRGVGTTPARDADLYLLTEPDQLVLFDPSTLIEPLLWDRDEAVRVRVIEPSSDRYRERLVLDDEGRVVRIQRRYTASIRAARRVLVTRSHRLATIWATSARSRREAWQGVRDACQWSHVRTFRIPGSSAVRGDGGEEHRIVDELVRDWRNPSASITGLRHVGEGVWATVDAVVPDDAVLVGPAWIGAGVGVEPGSCVIGPAFVADASAPELPVVVRPFSEIEPSQGEAPRAGVQQHAGSLLDDALKRGFDVVVSLLVLVVGLPVFALVALAVMLEDGWPVLYAQVRETRGGRKFRCWKFRSMYTGAERMADSLRAQNSADGPQVYIKDDPRVTRVGRLIRKLQVDELPQFWCVLVGDMSVVGPRPSPERENQYCPAWRELRLSVRPGITGLWQVRRRRAPGEDFQEWIRYDIEYVQRRSFLLDLRICLATAKMILLGGRR